VPDKTKFSKVKTEDLVNGQPVMTYTYSATRIVANATGVSINGCDPIRDPADLDTFAWVIAEAFKEHRRILAGIRQKLTL
jgi:hypothetical protein